MAFVQVGEPPQLWGIVGILVRLRRPARVGENGVGAGLACRAREFVAVQIAWSAPVRFGPRRDRGYSPGTGAALCGAVTVQADVSGCSAKNCRAVPGRLCQPGHRFARTPRRAVREAADWCFCARRALRAAWASASHWAWR